MLGRANTPTLDWLAQNALAAKLKAVFSEKERFTILHKLSDLKPESPGIAEPTTGLSMGQSAEIMAKDMQVAREDQDA